MAVLSISSVHDHITFWNLARLSNGMENELWLAFQIFVVDKL